MELLTELVAYDILARFGEFRWTIKGWFYAFSPRYEQDLLHEFSQWGYQREDIRKALELTGERGEGEMRYYTPKGPFYSDPVKAGIRFLEELAQVIKWKPQLSSWSATK